MGQRAALVSKVKKARQELMSLENRERGVVRSTQQYQSRLDVIGYDLRDVKAAIIAETNSFPQEPSTFLVHSMAVEKRYTEKLLKQIEEFDTVGKTVSSFTSEAVEVMTFDEEVAANQRRLQLLTEELKSLQSQL
jgi:hypothetical protein